MDIDSTPALQRAIELVGGQSELARRLSTHTGRSVKQPHVWWWLNKSRQVPGEYCRPIEAVTEGQVRPAELRPDIFGTA